MVKSLPNRIVHHVPSSPKKLAWHIKQASRTTLVAALAVPSLSLAQEPIRLEEIIVTATKRETCRRSRLQLLRSIKAPSTI